MARTSSPASPMSRSSSRFWASRTASLVSFEIARLAAVSVRTSATPVPSRRSESASSAAPSSSSLHSRSKASFLCVSSPPSLKRKACARAAMSFRAGILSESRNACMLCFEEDIGEELVLRRRKRAGAHEFKRCEEVDDFFVLVARVREFRESGLEGGRKAGFQAPYHVFERENRRDGRFRERLGLRQDAREPPDYGQERVCG